MTIAPNGILQLANGRAVQLTEFSQRDIYINVVEGVPCTLVNNRTIDNERDEVKRASGYAPFVVEPKPIRLHNPRNETGEFTPASIPRIVCRAHFRSTPTPKAEEFDDISELTVIWFQDDYGLPSDASVLRTLRAIDWDALARNLGFF